MVVDWQLGSEEQNKQLELGMRKWTLDGAEDCRLAKVAANLRAFQDRSYYAGVMADEFVADFHQHHDYMDIPVVVLPLFLPKMRMS